MLVKFWDLDTRHCFKTLVSHRSEVNDLILVNNEERLLTGCHDNELRVFEIKIKNEENNNNSSLIDNEASSNEIEPNLKKLRIKNNSEDRNLEKDGEKLI